MAESAIAVYGALAANVAIATTKFIVAGITGSSAMFSEAIHSVVDTGNGGLLLVGIHRSRKPPSDEHPFGHGKELYFWSLIVAVLIFGVGGGLSFYEGVVHFESPKPIESPMWNYIVLGCAAVFEGASFTLAWRQFAKQRGDTPVWRAVHMSKDPSNYTIIAEDGAALIGLALAAAGVFLSDHFGMHRMDAVASMLIGVLLAAVATLLIRESRGLLVGEGIRGETAHAIRQMALEEPGVREVGPLLSMYIGAEEVLLTFDLHIAPDKPAGEVAETIARLEDRIRSRFETVRRIYIEPRAPSADGG
jgi:cation diffusion facilitator family transporter